MRKVDTSLSSVTTTSQYEDYPGDTKFLVHNIFDGDAGTNAVQCSCCGRVAVGGWIQVDLGGLYILDHIVIKSRSDSKC